MKSTTQAPDLNRTERPEMIHSQFREVEVKLPHNSVIVQIPEKAYDPFKAFLQAGSFQPRERSNGDIILEDDEEGISALLKKSSDILNTLNNGSG